MNCKHKNITKVEVLWDYDGILYTVCKDCWLKTNIHSKVVFDETKTVEEYTPVYFFYKWNLVSYSRYLATWLKITDDLTLPENILWWSWAIKVFKPLKLLTKAHMKNILKDYNSWKQVVNKSILKYFESILDIK